MTIRHVLITRPAEDSAPLAAACHAAGLVPLATPLLRVTLRPDAVPDLAGAQAVILTSAHAARAAAGRAAAIPVFAVGRKTANVAREAGFTHVMAADGDMTSLEAMLAAAGMQPGAPVYYLSGREITGMPSVPGVTVIRHIVYHVDKIESFAPEAQEALAAGTVAAVVLMSVRTGEAFAAALARSGLTDCLKTIKALCISDSVLDSVAHLPWRDGRAAAQPDVENMCALLAAAAD